jgi:TP901 family phage tail tape measure protein
MSASAVRMGRAFVEIGADASKLYGTIAQVNKRIGQMGANLRQVGGQMAAAGAALTAPVVAAVGAASRFEDVLLSMRASTGATAEQLDAVRAAAMTMSAALGIGPTQAAQGFLELLKAGVSLEQVLGGAGQAAVQFAKVAQMDVASAAVVMADAMNVFGVTSAKAADTLSAAADASSTSIEGIALAMSQVSAVAGLANQSIEDTSAALALLANAGIKGSDAGTSLKTMLQRLMAPADEAVDALARLNLTVDSFRDAEGKMLPMVQIIGRLNQAMAGMDQAAKDDVFRQIFGSDAIRAAAVLTTAGVDGFAAMRDGMAGALSVADKFGVTMGGLSGTGLGLLASLERLAIAIGSALAPSLTQAFVTLSRFAEGAAAFVSNNQETIALVAQLTAGFIGLSVAIYAVGGGLAVVSATVSAIMSPIVLIPALIAAAVAGLVAFTGNWSALSDAVADADLVGAVEVVINSILNIFTMAGTQLYVVWDQMWSNVVQSANTVGAVLTGIMDNILNGIMASWDAMVATVQKSWNYVQSFLQKGYDLAKENEKVDSEMAARARQREQDRPGVAGRMAQADKENQQTAADSDRRVRAAQDAAQDKVQERADSVERRRQQREADRKAAAEARKPAPGAEPAPASNPARDAANRQAEDLSNPSVAADSQPADASAMQAGMQNEERSRTDIAGTFSAAAIGGLGVGSSLSQRQIDLLTAIDKGIVKLVDQGTDAVAT